MEFHIDLFPLFLVCATAWVVPVVLSIVGMGRVPTVIVEILLGIAIGEYGLDLIGGAEYLNFLGLLGFIFLMFLSGLEVDVEQILATFPRRRITPIRFISNPLLVGILLYIGTLLLSYIAARGFATGTSVEHAWYFSLMMSTTSVGVIVPVLKNRGEVHKRFGQILILSAAIADILSIFLFTFTASYLRNGFRAELLLIFMLLLVFLITYLTVRYFAKMRVVKKLLYKLAHAASQIKVRGTMFLILVFVVVSQVVQAEVILGAFLAGLILSIFMSKERSALMLKLDGIGYGFFIPIFFIMVGANLDLGALKDFNNSFLFLGSLLVVLYLVKLIPSLLLSRLFGIKKALSGGFLLASRLSLVIAAAQIGLQLGVISPGLNAAMIVVSILTCTLSPLIYGQMDEEERVLEQEVVIIGGTGVGTQLAERMKMHGFSVVMLESKEDRYRGLVHSGFDVLNEDGKRKEVYEEIGLLPENFVVVVKESEEENMEIAKVLREEIGHDKVIVKPNSDQNAKEWKELDVQLVDPDTTLAASIENLILRPTTYSALLESFENFTVEELTITNKELDGKQVKEIPFHQDGSLMLIRRRDDMYIPHGETYFQLGDVVTVIGNEEALEDFRNKFTWKL